eukprot:2391263-Rhodomonas_salina.3
MGHALGLEEVSCWGLADRVQSAGCRVVDGGCRVQGAGCRVQGGRGGCKGFSRRDCPTTACADWMSGAAAYRVPARAGRRGGIAGADAGERAAR